MAACVVLPPPDIEKLTRRSRTAYTDEDDNHLIEFIATNNPGYQGRSGNALYQLLENGKTKWPWGQHHPWQSWRDRYCRNQRWFDLKIRAYQKKYGLTTENSRFLTGKHRTAVEAEADDVGEELGEKRKRARHSEGENAGGKRLKTWGKNETRSPRKDKGEGSSRGHLKADKVRARAKIRKEEEEEGSEREQKEVKQKRGPEEGDDDEGEAERTRGPVGSDDYHAESFKEEEELFDDLKRTLSEEDQDEEAEATNEVDEILESFSPSVKSEPEGGSSPRTLLEPNRNGKQRLPSHHVERWELYPDIGQLPSPHPDPRDHHKPNSYQRVPGAFQGSSQDQQHFREPQRPSPPQHPIKSRRDHSRHSKPGTHHSPHDPGKTIINEPEPTTSAPKPRSKAQHLKRRKPSPSFFESLPPSPHQSADANANSSGHDNNDGEHGRAESRSVGGFVKRPLPRIIEGPFGDTFAGTRKGSWSSDSDEERGKPWPPVRGKGAFDKGKARRDTGAQSEVGNEWKKERVDQEVQTEGPSQLKKAAVVSRPPPQINAVASSSRVTLSPKPIKEPTKHHSNFISKATGLKPSYNDPEVVQRRSSLPTKLENARQLNIRNADTDGNTDVKPRRPTVEPINYQMGEAIKTKGGVVDQAHSITFISPVTLPPGQRGRTESMSSTSRKSTGRSKEPNGLSSGIGPLARRVMVLQQEHEASKIYSPNNPFVVQPSSDSTNIKDIVRTTEALERRHTIDNLPAKPSIPHIDLRLALVSGNRLRARSSLPSRMSSTTPIVSRHGSITSTGSALPSIIMPKDDEILVNRCGMQHIVSRMAENHQLGEEIIWNVWERCGSIAVTDEVLRQMKINAEMDGSRRLERALRDPEAFLAHLPQPAYGLGPDAPETAPAQKADGRPLSKSPDRPPRSGPSKPHSRKRSDLQVRPMPEDDGRLSEYSPPYASRAGRYTRLLKRGRMEEAVQRAGPRITSGGGVFPGQYRRSGTSESPTKGPHRKEGTDHIMLGNAQAGSDDSEPEPHEDVVWGNAEALAFLSARQGDAETLQALERRVNPDFLVKWAAARLAEFVSVE